MVEIGLKLERLRQVLTKTTKGMTVHSPLPTYIYVFKNERSFGPYKLDDEGRPTRVAGYFVGASDANYVAVDAAAAESSFSVIYHEYLHYFMNNNLPNLPQWLDENEAELVIAGGMGRRAQGLFAQAGIRVVVGAPSAEPRRIAEDYLAGRLQTGENICDH